MLPRSNGSDLLVLGAAERDWLTTTGSAGPTPPDDEPGDGSLAPQQEAPRLSASGPPLPPFQSTGLAAFGSVVGDPMDMADFISSDAASLLHRMAGEEWQQGVGTLNPGSSPSRPSRRPSAAGRRTTPAMRPASAAAADVPSPQQGQGQQGQGLQFEMGVAELPLDPGECLNAGLDAAGGERSSQRIESHSPVVPVVPIVPGVHPASGILAARPASSRSMRQSTSKVRRQCVCMCMCVADIALPMNAD